MSEEVLPLRERLAARRAAREQQQQNGADTRAPRTLDSEPPAEKIVEVEKAVDPPTELRRRRFVEPAPRPEEPALADKPVLPPVTQRRKIVNEAGEVVAPPTTTQPLEKVAEAIGVKLPDTPTRTERVMEQARQVSNEIVVAMLECMRAGEQLLITREDEKLWKVVMPTSAVGNYEVRVNPAGVPTVEVDRKVSEKPGRVPAGFEESMMNPDYLAWQNAWRKASVDTKISQAEKLGIPMPDQAATDPLIFNMTLSMGVQKALNLSKWKPEYNTQEARKLAKEKAMRGLDW